MIFSNDGKRLVVGDTMGNIVFWDIQTESVLQSYHHPAGKPSDMPEQYQLFLTPDDRYLISMGQMGTCLWDVETGIQIYQWESRASGGAYPYDNPFFSPDSRSIVLKWTHRSTNEFGLYSYYIQSDHLQSRILRDMHNITQLRIESDRILWLTRVSSSIFEIHLKSLQSSGMDDWERFKEPVH